MGEGVGGEEEEENVDEGNEDKENEDKNKDGTFICECILNRLQSFFKNKCVVKGIKWKLPLCQLGFWYPLNSTSLGTFWTIPEQNRHFQMILDILIIIDDVSFIIIASGTPLSPPRQQDTFVIKSDDGPIFCWSIKITDYLFW